MNDAAPIARAFFTASAALFFPLTGSAQVGLNSGMNSMGGGFDAAPHHSAHPISSGFPGATYTPFERLRHESRTTRKHAVQSTEAQQEGDKALAEHTAADKIDTDEVNVHETAFRVRTDRIFPQPSLAVATKTFQPIYLSADSPRERQIRKKLEEPADKMEFTEAPLRDVVAEIEDLHGIPVQLDAKACEDAGLELDAPITRSVHDVSLRSAIHLLLGDFDLTYLVTDDVLMVTTKDKAAENVQVVLYPVPWGYDLASLINAVQNTVSPQTWSAVGGAGAIQRADRFLCVSQTEDVHDEVRQFVERLGESEFMQVDDSEAAMNQRVVTRIHPVADPKVLGDLGTKLTGICNTALGAEGDATAKVSVVGDRLVVQSSSRAFHVYATDVVAAFNGVEVTCVERFEGHCPERKSPTGGGMSGGMF